tara:strand:+ start:93 stop:866 length:774 start_codon:yes stop_codon:yes gene_type:complete
MQKKQKYNRMPEEENNMTYSQEMSQQLQPTEVLDAEEESYKKRYQDIQRHIQTVRNQKDQEIAKIQDQLNAATRKQIKFPKTDQEVEQWSKRYPDVAKIVDTIAQKRANEALRIGEQRLKKVEQFEKQVHRKSAEQQLAQRHPDYGQIKKDPKFHEWVALQHSTIQDSVYKNNSDAAWAASTIDLYKAQTGKARRSKGAAQAVGRTSSTAPSSGQGITFSESLVDAMSDREYAANEEAIEEAIRSGKFSYDMTGAAR